MPGEGVNIRRDTPAQAVRRLIGHLWSMGRRRLALVVGLNALAGLAEGVGIFTLVPLLNFMGVSGGAAPTGLHLAVALLGYVGLVAVTAAIKRGRSLALTALNLDFLDRLRTDLHAAVLAMEWRRFRSQRSAELQQVLTGEIVRIGAAVSMLANLTGALLTVPFLLVVSFALSPVLTLTALLVAGTAMLATRKLGARGYAIGRELSEKARGAMADVADDLAGFRIIKSFGAEAPRHERMARRFTEVRGKQIDHNRLQSNERAVMQVAAAVAAAVALYVAMAVLRQPLADTLVLILA